MKFGSVCSGIEAASLAFKPIGMEPVWFSEVAAFPSKVLAYHHPDIPNLGDMNDVPDLIKDGTIEAPDILCGGTPCQAFSLAGWKEGLIDSRGQLTLKFIEVADAIDEVRQSKKLDRSIILWENVEGVLKDKTNAFGVFLAGLAGLNEEVKVQKWSTSGVLVGPNRKIAWRVLDAKFFGLPQQRRRLFVVATNHSLNPEAILFETINNSNTYFNNLKSLYHDQQIDNQNKKLSLFDIEERKTFSSSKIIDDHKIQVFRSYTDCLYSAYGTKWNGNAAAYNGSLYFAQNERVRRLTPLECERLMGFPDNYTNLTSATDTTRYQAVGNSWAIPVIEWLGARIQNYLALSSNVTWLKKLNAVLKGDDYSIYLFKDEVIQIGMHAYINATASKNDPEVGDIFDVVHIDAPSKFYISSKASQGILRRKNERNLKMNPELEKLFMKQSHS